MAVMEPGMNIFCHICGNEIAAGSKVCAFCGSMQDEKCEKTGRKPFVHRTVNLEAGKPHVEPAMHRLHAALDEARSLDVQALTFIHGYGSSGQGGAIRRECRKVLDHMNSRGDIREVIAGEDFHRRSGPIRNLLRQYPQLENNANLNRGNKGVTLVIL